MVVANGEDEIQFKAGIFEMSKILKIYIIYCTI